MNSFDKYDYDYSIGYLIAFLNDNKKITNISIQFDKECQGEFQICLYQEIVNKLSKNKKLYIIGDTSYGNCCCDEITALHLNSDIIIRVGSSCFTRNNKIPIYFLFKNKKYKEDEINIFKAKINQFIQSDDNQSNYFIFYNEKTKKYLIDSIKSLYSTITFCDIENDDIDITNTTNNNSPLLYGRNMHGMQISKESQIIYIGKESDLLITELSLRYINKINSISVIDMDNFDISKISHSSINPFLYRRFNLMEKAKQSSTFGILIGSLSIQNLKNVINEIKSTLIANNKKCYTFLLGKITEEKLANFMEYIDCFILIACPFNNGYNNKALYKPIVSPLDIKIAFDKNYCWDSVYSLDVNYLKVNNDVKGKINYEKIKEIEEMEKKCQSLQVKDTNEALAPVFSVQTLIQYDKRKFKGLSDKGNEDDIIPKKAIKGKKGIPIKYEDL